MRKDTRNVILEELREKEFQAAERLKNAFHDWNEIRNAVLSFETADDASQSYARYADRVLKDKKELLAEDIGDCFRLLCSDKGTPFHATWLKKSLNDIRAVEAAIDDLKEIVNASDEEEREFVEGFGSVDG